jgi:hypothetical protein
MLGLGLPRPGEENKRARPATGSPRHGHAPGTPPGPSIAPPGPRMRPHSLAPSLPCQTEHTASGPLVYALPNQGAALLLSKVGGSCVLGKGL